MARPGRKTPRQPEPKPKARVVDERPLNKILPRSQEPGNTTHAIRTVMYIELGDVPPEPARKICQDLLKSLPQAHPHYVVPVRNGKLMSDLDFEEEFLNTVNAICEVIDGKIVMRTGAKDVDVIRWRA